MERLGGEFQLQGMRRRCWAVRTFRWPQFDGDAVRRELPEVCGLTGSAGRPTTLLRSIYFLV